MLTIFIIILGLVIMGSIITGIIQAENSDFIGLHVCALFVMLVLIVASITTVNQSETTANSNVLVKPSIKIETITNDSNVIKSDTTYIYKFKNNN